MINLEEEPHQLAYLFLHRELLLREPPDLLALKVLLVNQALWTTLPKYHLQRPLVAVGGQPLVWTILPHHLTA
jgi:hypothetical protein